MAVTPATEPILKSHPDMTKLNAFSDITITVTKHVAPRNTTGQMIVPTQRIGKEALLALMTSLPLQYGPGFYRFEAVDSGGQIEDKWMVKLGTEVMPTQEGLPMGQPPFMQQPPVPGAPLDPGVTQIMPGFYYNEALGLLTTPWRETVAWRTNDPWPKPPASVSAGHLSLVPPNATPFTWPGQQPQSGWGGWPATESKSPELEALKLQMAEDRRRSEEADRRREDREREDRRVEEAKREREASEARFEKMFALMTAKPAGPSEAEQRLQREIEENRRRTEAAEQRVAEAQRETQRREELRLADERHREEMRLMREEIKAATANKTDPMMTLFGTILQTQAAGATETARMIRETSQAAQAASERSTTQVLDLARSQRETASESSKTVLEGMKGLMEMQTGVYNQLLEVAGNSGGQPWYAGVLQEGVGKIGLLGQALMERNQAAAVQPQVMQQRIVQARPGQPMPPGARPMPGQPVRPQMAAAPVETGTGVRPPDAEYDPVTEEFFFPDGWRVKQAVVQQSGWVAVLKRRPPPTAAAAPPLPTAPVNGTNGAVTASPVVPDVVLPPAPAARAAKPAKANKKKGRAAAPAVEPEAPAVPPPANGVGYSTEEIRAMEPEQVEEITNVLDDSALFGAMLPYVLDLRAKAANGLPVVKAAEFILGTRAYANSFGAAPPPAFELLAADHLEVLVERLLPDAPEAYQDAVIEIMEKQLDAENPQRAELAEQ